MKYLMLCLFSIFIAPSLALADASDFDEIDYVFRSFQSETPPTLQDCYDVDPGTAITPTSAGSFDLYSLQSKKTNGRVLKEDIKKIGHVLTCVDFTGLSIDNPYIILPAYFKVTLDGMELILKGQGQFRSLDVPEPNVGMATYSLRVIDGPPEVIGGWLVSNTIANALGVPGYLNGSFATIRLFTPAVKKDGK